MLLLLASRLSDAIEQYPQFLKEIEELQKQDPSGNLKYLDWQLKQLKRNEPLNEIISLTETFHKRRSQLEKKDLNGYKTLGDLREAIEALGKSRKDRLGEAQEDLFSQERARATKNGIVVYDSDDVLVIKPRSVEESCYFGNNTKWCISATESENFYTEYSLNGQHFYFIINKNLPIRHPFQKVSWQGLPNRKPSFWRSDDVDEEGNSKPFQRNSPDFKKWLALTPNLEVILERIAEHLKKNQKNPLWLRLEKGNLFDLGDRDKLKIAMHYNTPLATLQRLAKDDDVNVRTIALARLPDTPPAILEQLADNKDWQVRAAVAGNPNLPQAARAKLANEDGWGLVRHLAALRNPSTSTADLESIAKGENVFYNSELDFPEIRLGLARHPNTPLAVVDHLANSENEPEDIRKAAQENLERRSLSARVDALVEATTQLRLSAYARLALEEAAAILAARMPFEEALRVLGVDRAALADKAALKKAYRAASMKSHPDRGGSTALMQKVNEAYEVLSEHHEPQGVNQQSKAEQEAAYAEAVARALRIVQVALAKAFDPAAFVRHFEKAAGKEFIAEVQQKVEKDYHGNPRLLTIDAAWRSTDGETVFSLYISVNLADVTRVRMLGGGGDNFAFTVSTRVSILHDNRKSKFQQRDWSFTSEARVLMDPADLFPADKIKKMMQGKEKARKFSARDMKLGMEKYLDAKIEDQWAQFPVGPPVEVEATRFPRAHHNRFVVKMWRSVLMRMPYWDLHSVEGPFVPKQGRQKYLPAQHASAAESEALLQALVEMQKQAANVQDGDKLAEMAAKAFLKARQKVEARVSASKLPPGFLSKFDFSNTENTAPSSEVTWPEKETARIIETLERGDVVKIGSSKWAVFRKQDNLTVSAYKWPSKKKKIYTIRLADDPDTLGEYVVVFEIGGSGQRIGPDIAKGKLTPSSVQRKGADLDASASLSAAQPHGSRGHGGEDHHPGLNQCGNRWTDQ